jgi:hypothetical protein
MKSVIILFIIFITLVSVGIWHVAFSKYQPLEERLSLPKMHMSATASDIRTHNSKHAPIHYSRLDVKKKK